MTTFINFFNYKNESDLLNALKVAFIHAYVSNSKLYIENVLTISGIYSWDINPNEWDYRHFVNIYQQTANDFFYIKNTI